MLQLVIARIMFVAGAFAIFYMSGVGLLPDPMIGGGLVILLVLFCELVIAKKIKSGLHPPLTVRQKRIALLPWAPILLLVVGALAAAIGASIFSPSSPSPLSKNRTSQGPNVSTDERNPSQSSSQWVYKKTANAMTGSISHYAVLDTKQESGLLPFATLELRESAELGNAISISVQNIKFCLVEHCNILVRFDDQQPEKYSVTATNDPMFHTQTVTILDNSRFLERLKKSNRIRVSQEQYSQGSPFAEFIAAGFDVRKFAPAPN